MTGGPNLEIYDIVARWPGSAHDSIIFNESRLKARFEANKLEGTKSVTEKNYFIRFICYIQ